MLRSPDDLAAVDRRYAREILAQATYQEALAHFRALWEHALKLNPAFPASGVEDLDADIELARVLKGLPSGA